eukprot:7379367-Prymnesium_polylepis.1
MINHKHTKDRRGRSPSLARTHPCTRSLRCTPASLSVPVGVLRVGRARRRRQESERERRGRRVPPRREAGTTRTVATTVGRA